MKVKSTAVSKIKSYLKRVKNGATANEVARATKLNRKTVQNRLAELTYNDVWYSENRVNCKVTGHKAQVYGL